MKAKPCKLVVNNRWGYTYAPHDCKSLSEAIRTAKNYGDYAFAYRVTIGGKVVRRGYTV